MSFTTNTNWQSYAGEVTMSNLTQMLGLAVHNFTSAAVGMAVMAALIRGLARRRASTLGNFWVDLTRTMTRILVPISFVLALFFVSQGVIQNFHGNRTVTTVEGTEQVIPGGPVASQIAIKQVGTNGGGFFNMNSAHPFENSGPLNNFVETVRDRRSSRSHWRSPTDGWWATNGRAAPSSGSCSSSGPACRSPRWASKATGTRGSTPPAPTNRSPRRSPAATWKARRCATGRRRRDCGRRTTTGTSNGSVNSMHDSYTPLGGMVPLSHMMLGEVSPGGVGVGLNGLLILVILSVFIAGLDGRTDSGVPRQEDPSRRDEARRSVHPRDAGGPARLRSGIDVRGIGTRHARSSIPGRTDSPRSCMRSRRPRTTTALRSPASPPTTRLDGHDIGHRDAHRTVHADHPGARDRGIDGAQATDPRERRNVPDPHAPVRRAGDRRDARWSPD